jgi:hypothetical protein
VTVVELEPLAPRAVYPRVVKYRGASPPQYPDMDEERGANELGSVPAVGLGRV